MTRERASEILRDGAQYSNYSDKMTPDEIAEVKAIWSTMPGHTCFYDAIVRIYQGRAVNS